MQSMNHKVTNHLLNYLSNGDEVDRCYAAKTLGNLKSKEATPALLERIRDDDIDVCIDAITALGKIKEPSTVPVLLDSLEKDPDGEVKLAVTESLAQFQSQEAIDALMKLAEDRPENMYFDENDDWDSWWDLQEKAIVILGEMKVQAAFPILRNVLEDDFSQDIETTVLKAMAKIGGDADDYLIDRLAGAKDSPVKEKQQRRTATALGFSQSNTTLKALGRALVSNSADTRENVLYALGKRKASQYIPAILLCLRDPHNNVKRAALAVIQDLATDTQIHLKVDFNQVADLLSESDSVLRTAVLSFFLEQQKITPVFDSLTDANQNLFRACLDCHNDNVITHAAQFVSLIGDKHSVDSLMTLALSASQSEWVRQETILALGNLFNKIDSKSTQADVLANLRQLIHNNQQTVRFAAIQAILTISNITEAPSINFEAHETLDELPPIAILLATLKGERFDIDNDDSDSQTACASDSSTTDSISTADNCSSCAKNSSCAGSISNDTEAKENIMQEFRSSNINDNDHLIESLDDQPIATAMSTIEAIAMDNIESALAVVPESPQEKNHDIESGPFISEDLPEELDEFVTIMRQNFHTGKKLSRRKVDTFSDARHSCARLLCENSQARFDEIIVNALTESLNDNDEQLRLEAAEALSRISLKNPTIAGLNNAFGKLVTLLDSKDSDMKLACIHAISHCGNPAALPHLLNCLNDQDYLVKLHAIQGLVFVINNKANLTEKQMEGFMVVDEISHENVITALFKCLDEKNYSISMAAIEALVELDQKEAIEQFIDVALTDEGQSARRISKLLKKLDTQKSTELLLARLDNVSDSSYRRYVMEMLEVVVSPEAGQKEAA